MTTGSTAQRDIVVLDTDVISELMRAAPDLRVHDWVREAPPASTYTTAIILAEVRLGLAQLPAGRRRTLVADANDFNHLGLDRPLAHQQFLALQPVSSGVDLDLPRLTPGLRSSRRGHGVVTQRQGARAD